MSRITMFLLVVKLDVDIQGAGSFLTLCRTTLETTSVSMNSRIVQRFSRSCVYGDVVVDDISGVLQRDVHRTVLRRSVALE